MAVAVESYVSARGSTADAVADLDAQLSRGGGTPHFAFVFYGQCHDDAVIDGFLRARLPGVPLVGGTSCAGVMSDHGLGGADSVGLLLVHDPDGAYGSAAAPLGDDASDTAQQTLTRALASADAAGELPELIWVYQSPGQEEAVIAGLRRVVGDRCPIIGGSSADDDVSGVWRQMGPDGPMRNGVVVGVLFPSGGVGFGFQGGYEPTGEHGVVTELGDDTGQGVGRHILTIDGAPAAEVYNGWLGGTLPADAMEHGGPILEATTSTPLAVGAGSVEGVTYYQLIHPEAITPQKGLATFAAVERGARVHGMRGNRDHLVTRVGRVVSTAQSSLHVGANDVAGGIVVYCAGCLLAVGDRAPEVADTARQSFGDAPFLGSFTFGEQGTILDRNLHANLMISAVVFGR